ncbi:MAG: hypothetical protein V4566_05490 [Pseudomonadota bacterium]|jgi:hypothetical protein
MKLLAAYLGIPLLLAGLTIGRVAHATDAYTDGWVSHVDGQHLDVCYRVAPLPAVGARLQVMRASFVVPNKGQPRQQFAVAGHATVTSIMDAHCVRAELSQGTAQRTDHVRRAP